MREEKKLRGKKEAKLEKRKAVEAKRLRKNENKNRK